MNLSNEKLKLFKVATNSYIYHNFDGDYIGNDVPSKDQVTYDRIIYVAARHLNEAANYLHDNGIGIISIEKHRGRLITVPWEKE